MSAKLPPFVWVSLAFTSASILVSLYILTRGVEWSRDKWKYDGYHRIRYILVVLLLFNRLAQCLHLVLYIHEFTLVNGHPSKLLSIDIMNILSMCSLYATLFSILLLTMNRHQRVKMILPGTWTYRALLLAQGLVLCGILVAVFGYVIRIFFGTYFGIYAGNYPVLGFIDENRLGIEGAVLIFGMILHYLFTLILIYTCISPHLSQPRLGFLQHVFVRQYQPLHRVILYCIGLFLTDITILTVSLVSNFSDTQGGDVKLIYYTAFGYSWLPIHVWCLFQLFDMLVKSLGHVKRVKKQKNNLVPMSLLQTNAATSASTHISYVSSFTPAKVSKDITNESETQDDVSHCIASRTFEDV